MDKKIVGLLGAVAALGTFGSAQAAPAPADVLQANSYADLLEPIPNAGVLLQAIDESAPVKASENVQLAQYYYHHHHHHHHHHHSFYRRYRYYDDAPVVVVPRYRPYYHHHHHHHHHHNFYYRRDY